MEIEDKSKKGDLTYFGIMFNISAMINGPIIAPHAYHWFSNLEPVTFA